MYCLEHGIALADIAASGRSDAALELGGLIGYDIAVKVGKNKDLKVCTALFVDKLGGGDVDIPVVCGYFGILLAYRLAEIEEFSVGWF